MRPVNAPGANTDTRSDWLVTAQPEPSLTGSASVLQVRVWISNDSSQDTETLPPQPDCEQTGCESDSLLEYEATPSKSVLGVRDTPSGLPQGIRNDVRVSKALSRSSVCVSVCACA